MGLLETRYRRNAYRGYHPNLPRPSKPLHDSTTRTNASDDRCSYYVHSIFWKRRPWHHSHRVHIRRDVQRRVLMSQVLQHRRAASAIPQQHTNNGYQSSEPRERHCGDSGPSTTTTAPLLATHQPLYIASHTGTREHRRMVRRDRSATRNLTNCRKSCEYRSMTDSMAAATEYDSGQRCQARRSMVPSGTPSRARCPPTVPFRCGDVFHRTYRNSA